MPYVYHPFHLAEQMNDEDTTIVALLHDVVEDTDYTLDDLSSMGFSDRIIDAISLMTHDKNIPYRTIREQSRDGSLIYIFCIK